MRLKLSKTYLALLFILIMAAAIRFYALGRHGFWLDECTTIIEQERFLDKAKDWFNFSKPWEQTNRGALMYFNYIGVFWRNLVGVDEFKIRLFPAVLGILAVIPIFLLGKTLFNNKVGLMSALILAIQPIHVYYSQEMRSYAMLSFTTVLTVLFWIKALKNNKFLNWCFYVVFIVFSIYMHYIVLLLLLGNIIYFLFLHKEFKNRYLPVIFAHLTIAILMIPFLVDLWNTTLEGFKYLHDSLRPLPPFPVYLSTFGIKNVFFSLKNLSVGYSFSFFEPIGFFGTLFFVALFIIGVGKNLNKRKSTFILVTSFILPLTIVFALSKFIVPCYAERHFMPFAPFFYIGIALAICFFKRREKMLIIIFILITSLIGINEVYANKLTKNIEERLPVEAKKDCYSPTKFIYDNFKSGDAIFHTCTGTVFPMRLYSEASIFQNDNDFQREIYRGAILYTFDASDNLSFLALGESDLKKVKVVNPQELFKPLDIDNAGCSRVWLVFSPWDYINNPDSDFYKDNEKIRSIFRKRYPLVMEKNFRGIDLLLFDLKKQNK